MSRNVEEDAELGLVDLDRPSEPASVLNDKDGEAARRRQIDAVEEIREATGTTAQRTEDQALDFDDVGEAVDPNSPARDFREAKDSEHCHSSPPTDFAAPETSSKPQDIIYSISAPTKPEITSLHAQAISRISTLLRSHSPRGDFNELVIALDDVLLKLNLWVRDVADEPGVSGPRGYDNDLLSAADSFNLQDVMQKVTELGVVLESSSSGPPSGMLEEACQAVTELQNVASSLTSNTMLYGAILDRRGQVSTLRARLQNIEQGSKKVLLHLSEIF
jgi:hypothetical protein